MKKALRYCIVALLAGSAIWGCKKDDETVNTPSLNGLYLSSVPSFVAVADVLKVDADITSLTTSDRSKPGPVSLIWQVNSAQKDTLTKDAGKTNPQFSYRIDTLGSYTIFCYAYAKDYYSASATASFKAIAPDTALEGVEHKDVVNLDGQDYGTVAIGGKTWLSQNLYKMGLGASFENSPVVDVVFGRLYNWKEAQTACPAGWHLPTAAEFDQCLGTDAGALMADASFLKEKMWEYWPGVTPTNSLGFNAIPVGYWDKNNKVEPYGSYSSYAAWWTASSADQKGGEYRYIYEDLPQVQKAWGDKETLYMSVRCVQD